MEITEDNLDDLVQQICFSSVELGIHNAQTPLSPEDIEHIWMTEHAKYYGKEGEIFTFRDINNLWITMHLFFDKFYTHNYASGRLLASALFQASKRDKTNFKKRYITLLSDGGAKNLKEALAPFDFNPDSKQFWSTTIKNTLEPLIAKTEAAAKEAGYL
jgi:oligoendopeptidase F